MKKFCSQCGNPLPQQGKFCPKCGTAVEQQIEEVELGEVTKINTKKKSFSFGSFRNLPKQKIGMVVGVLVAIVLVVFFMNRNPLQGNWEPDDNYFKGGIHIKGNNAELLLEKVGSTELVLSGKLRKKNKNEYILPIQESTVTMTEYDAVSNKIEFEEEVRSMVEELTDYSLGTADRKKIEKWIKQIKLNGTDISWTIRMKDLDEMTRLTNKDFFNIGDLRENLILSKKGDNKLALSDKNSNMELMFKKLK